MFESSYNDHVNRKSIQITYLCRFCNQTKVFFNRCKLLFHIRSHAFKTTTINVNALKVEPLPLSFFKIQNQNSSPRVKDIQKKMQNNGCYECKQRIVTNTGTAYKDRANHFMQYTNEVLSCPICLFALPTVCALKAHLRFHLNCPPFYCPECGVHLPAKNVQYPYGHDCEGFKMMRATTRLKCPVRNCHLFHPNDFKEHMKENHLKKVYKCPYCVVASFNEVTMNKHLEGHDIAEAKALIFYQCELCPGRLVVQNNMDNHLRTHTNAPIFPCWACGTTFKEVCILLDHHLQKHGTNATIAIKNTLSSVINESENQQGNTKRIYRVVKRCDQCKRYFTYKCNFNEISVLPNECPFKCAKSQTNVTTVDTEPLLTCHLCKEKISQNWEEIKEHYAKNHKMHKCLDTKVVLHKIDVSKFNKKKRRLRNAATRKVKPSKRQQLITTQKLNEQESVKPVTSDVSGRYCTNCEYTCESKEQLETHFLSHKDLCMAYQCMECGKSFVVKPSFSTHLMLEHGISDVEEYILNKNRCYNENALEKYQSSNISFEPLKDNQCKICREQFDNSEDLAKHFRGHGMAFLLKSTSNKNMS